MRRAISVGVACGLFLVAAGLCCGLLNSAVLAGGCASCGGGGGAGCGAACEPACGTCDTGCEPCPPCGAGAGSCGGWIHPLAPVEWVLRFLGGSCGNGGCGGCSGETYWGDLGNGGCSPCDACGNYMGGEVGPAYGPAYAAPAGNCGPNGCAMRNRAMPSNGYVQRAPAVPNQMRSNGYARYPVRGQAMPAAYQARVQDPRLPAPRRMSVTDQVVPADQAPEITAARPVRQYAR